MIVIVLILSLVLIAGLSQSDQIRLALLSLLGVAVLFFIVRITLLDGRSAAKHFTGLPYLKVADAHWRVTQVIDGDIIRVCLGNEAGGTVRLVGIDAPESVHPDRPIEYFGKISTAMAVKLMLGERVRLEQDDSQGAVDDYGRVLAYVWLEDGTLANEWLVRNGFAREQMYYNKPCKYRSRLITAKSEARRSQRGMWRN